MSSIVSRLRYWGQYLGWSMVAGIALGIGAVLFYVVLGAPAAHQLYGIETGAHKMRTAMAKHEKNWIPESPRVSLRIFYQSLPAQDSIPDLLEQIFDAAYENNLALDTGEFKLTQEVEAAFYRYQITFPAQGSYSNTRKFVNRVLQEIPSVALDDIGFNRDDVLNPEVEAKMRFTLYVRDAS